jgi:hypothetical protein
MNNYSVKITRFGSTRVVAAYRNLTAAAARSIFLSYVNQGFTLGRCIYISKGNALIVGYGGN